jgi:hypothetical protein
MLQSILESGATGLQWDLRVTTVFIFLAMFVLTQAITSIQSHIALAQIDDAKQPPMVPYAIPGVGNLLDFVFDTREFYNKRMKVKSFHVAMRTNVIRKNSFGPNSAASFQILSQKMYFITGADNVLAFFKASQEVTTLDQIVAAMHSAFGSLESSREANMRDNTGVLAQPLQGSSPIGAHNRTFHIMHNTLSDSLTGPVLAELATRLMSNQAAELETLEIGDEWTDVPDFYAVVQ